jgi:hypothetical protein
MGNMDENDGRCSMLSTTRLLVQQLQVTPAFMLALASQAFGVLLTSSSYGV